MECTREQLMAYVDGEADEATARCLATCAECTLWVEQYRGLQRDLLEALFRRRCPTGQTLSDFYFGLLSSAEAEIVKLHLAECPHCPTELEALEQFLER